MIISFIYTLIFIEIQSINSFDFPKFLSEIQYVFSNYLNSFFFLISFNTTSHTTATPAASGWQSSSDVVDAIALSLHSDNPTKSLTHAICLNLSAKLSAVLHRRSAPSYVCAGAGAVYEDERQGKRPGGTAVSEVPNEIPREGRQAEGTRCLI